MLLRGWTGCYTIMTRGELVGVSMSCRGTDAGGCRGIPGNSNTVKWILDRKPTSWADRIRRDLKDIQS